MAARARGLIEEMAEGEAVRVVEGPAAKGRGLHVKSSTQRWQERACSARPGAVLRRGQCVTP